MVIDVEEKGNFADVLKRLAGVKNRAIYVGVPQENTSREEDENTSREEDGVTNAGLLFIHTNGIRRRSMINEMDKTMDSGKPYSKAYELYVMTHGSPLWHAPPRPVIEPAIAAHADKIARGFKRIYKAAIAGNKEALEAAIKNTGMAGQNAARGWFKDPRNGWAANSPATIARKGSARPLIDTGAMRQAIVYVVRDK